MLLSMFNSVLVKNVAFLNLILPVFAISHIVRTKHFQIRGASQKTATGKVVYSFLGVPFAKPPIGRLRYRPPEPLGGWQQGLLDGTKLAKTCYSALDTTFPGFQGAEMWNSDTEVTEDCLYLNLWVPGYPNDSGKLPVVVWIFGGGFYSGSPSLDLYNGSILAAENQVIVVNINYRLGPFGFLYLGKGSTAEGNMGLLDQRMALKWIRENVEAFGGNSEDVSLFGESAGGASVSAHLLSPGSANLFQKAFIQSGSIINKWARNTPETSLKRSMRIAEILDCDSNRANWQIAKCLRAKNAQQIQAAGEMITNEEMRILEFAFVPTDGDGGFFTENVTATLSRGNFKKRSVMIGTVADESTFWLPYYLPKIIKFDPKLPKNRQRNLLTRNEYLRAVNETFHNYFPTILKKSIAFHYSDELKIAAHGKRRAASFRDGVSRVLADYFFDCDIVNFADLLAQRGSDVYWYQFTQRSTTNPWPLWMGAMHGYEIEYFFGVPLRRAAEYTQAEVRFSRKLMKFWTNFVRNGFPSEDGVTKPWPVYTNRDRKYLILNAENSKIDSGLNIENCKFWEEVSEANKKLQNQNWTSSAAQNTTRVSTMVFLLIATLVFGTASSGIYCAKFA